MDTLFEIGFFNLVFGGPTTASTELSGDLSVLQMRSGDTTDPMAVGDLVDGLRHLFPDKDDNSEAGLVGLYGAMIEAVGNVVGHAYTAEFQNRPDIACRWWMTGAVDRKLRQTTAVVFDMGVSIPMSLPNWDRAEGWLRRFTRRAGMLPATGDTRADGDAIYAAVEESMTSTGEQHRGTGLAQMRDFVEQCRECRLRILSRCGEVIFAPGLEPIVRAHDVSLPGTLIEWSVSL